MRATRISAICPSWTDSILPRTGPVDQSGGASFFGPCTTAAAHKLPLMSDGRLTGCHRRCIKCHAAGRRMPTADTSDGNALVLPPITHQGQRALRLAVLAESQGRAGRPKAAFAAKGRPHR